MSYLFVLPAPPVLRRGRVQMGLGGDDGRRWRGPGGPPTKMGRSRSRSSSRSSSLALVGRRASTSSAAGRVRPRETVAATFPDVMVATQPGDKRALASTDGERMRDQTNDAMGASKKKGSHSVTCLSRSRTDLCGNIGAFSRAPALWIRPFARMPGVRFDAPAEALILDA